MWRMDSSYDAIVVGGGHNGLVCAGYLARAGRRVLVLEARELVGGCAVTEQIWPGYRVSTAAYLSSLMQEKVVRDLELERFGYRVDAKDPAFFSPFPDGRHLFMWQDRARTLAEIAKFSAKDAEAYPHYEAHLEHLAAVAESLLLTTPPEFPPRGLGDFVDYLKLAGRMRGLAREEIVGLVKVFTQNAADFLDAWFESEEVKVTLATDGVIGANGGPRSPGTAYILLHHCMGGVGGVRGLWGFVRGGMGAVSEAMAASARSKGVEIRVNAPVEKILVREGRASGVVLKTGEEIAAPVVASNLDPKRTFLDLDRAKPILPVDFVDGSASFVRGNLAQDESRARADSPDFTRLPGAPGPQHRATMHICPSIEYVERAWDDAKYGRPSQVTAHRNDDSHHVRSLARAGGPPHHGNLPAIRALHSDRKSHLGRQREPYAERVLDVIEEYCPNIRSIVVSGRRSRLSIWSAASASPAGTSFTARCRSIRCSSCGRSRAGLAIGRRFSGLYLCGSGAHPGGGVMGAPGHNAAREILRGR